MSPLKLDEIRLACIQEKNRLNAEIEKQKLRDYFAGKAMQAIANAICTIDDLNIISHAPDDIAQISYVYADAMMKAREQ